MRQIDPAHLPRALMLASLLAAGACVKKMPAGTAGPMDSGQRETQGPPVERCGNGIDDNGDGRIDEGCACAAGATQRCYRGSVGTRNVGACHDGMQACVVSAGAATGTWGDCSGDQEPTPELCGADGNGDTIDQDCNGATDDACRCSATAAPPPRECPGGPLMGECRHGIQTCGSDGKWSTCEGSVPPKPEICGDDKDNDCNGATDDGCTPPPVDGPNGEPPAPEPPTPEPPTPEPPTPEPPTPEPPVDAPPDLAPDLAVVDLPPDLSPDLPPEAPPASCEFKTPVVQCHFDDGTQVMATPMVVDVNGDGKPEILFPSSSNPDGTGTTIHAISGTDCSPVWQTTLNSDLNWDNDLAIGDLDDDGVLEVVAMSNTPYPSGLYVLNGRTGVILDFASVPSLYYHLQAPAIANLDGSGFPEIVVGSSAFRFAGGKLQMLFDNVEKNPPPNSSLPVVADLDQDGRMEVIGLSKIYDGVTGMVVLDLGAPGFPAVADFDPMSPGPEIIRVQPTTGEVVVLAGLSAPVPGKLLFGPYSLPPGFQQEQNGSAPAVGDVDGDGVPDFGVASAVNYTIFARRCGDVPMPADCAKPGVLWQRNSQDQSSAITTSAMFDFNCDGKMDVAYRDECFLRVIDGATGTVLSAQALSSGTELEGVAIADTDGSGRARIVIGTNTVQPGAPCPGADEYTGAPYTGASTGVWILKDPMDRWPRTRPVWNQNSYHVTNVNDDGTIPVRETASWTKNNSYRANVVLP